MHTEFSDGVSSPEHLARVAAIQELDIIAITDHDKVDGYERARAEGEKWGIAIIPGVEVSTDKYHILGLGINPNSKRLTDFLNHSNQEQRKVSAARIDVLKEQGIPISLEKLEKTFPHSRLGKMNLMMAIMQDEECRAYFADKGEKFGNALYKSYLKAGRGKEEIADKMTSITSDYAIREIHNAGGIAVIAHPFKEIGENMDELDNLRRQGLDGLEIQCKFNGRNEPFREYAKLNDMLLTYGSDWHAGLFGRNILDGKGGGENILCPKLAEALRL